MTLISNGPVSSFAVSNQEKSYKPESPPMNETDRNRFKESLDKAISEKTEVSEDNKKIPQKETVAEVPGNNEKPDEKQLVRGKKTAGTADLKQKASESGKESKTSLSTLLPHLKTEKGKTTLSGDKTEKTSLKKLDKKLTLQNTEEQTLIENLMVEGEDAEESALIQNLDGEKNPGEEPALINKTDSEAVVIPFPETGSKEISSAAAAASNGVKEQNHPVKVTGSNKKKSKEEPNLTVIDIRSTDKGENSKNNYVSRTSSISDNVEQSAKESNQIVLGEQNIGKAGTEELKSFESRLNENKEIPLARELKDTGNDQIVKKASIILKDNNQGEIKLILKPESLGRVKIHLNMNENNLVGKIIVENSRVGQIFENNLQDLSKSFEEAGISSSSIEVSVGDGNRQNGDQESSARKDQPFFSDRLKTMNEAVPSNGGYGSEDNQQLVNLVV